MCWTVDVTTALLPLRSAGMEAPGAGTPLFSPPPPLAPCLSVVALWDFMNYFLQLELFGAECAVGSGAQSRAGGVCAVVSDT